MRAKRDVQVRLPKLCRGAVKGAGHREQSHALDPPIAAQAESPVNTDSEMEVEEEQGTPEYTFMTLRSGRAKIAEGMSKRPLESARRPALFAGVGDSSRNVRFATGAASGWPGVSHGGGGGGGSVGGGLDVLQPVAPVQPVARHHAPHPAPHGSASWWPPTYTGAASGAVGADGLPVYPVQPPSVPRLLPGGGGARATAAATLALMDPEWGTKMPLFIMAPGALATFSGSDLCHGTTEHDDVRSAEAPPPLLV